MKIKKYHTVRTVPKSNKTYHTVRTVLKSIWKIVDIKPNRYISTHIFH